MTESNYATDTLLRKGGIQQRMRCSGAVAHNIEDAFTTVEKLLEAVESDDPLTDVDGIGPKTAEVIEDWYENRRTRERKANSATVDRTSSKSLSISFHNSWADALGIEESDSE
ncbi:helix-hairpin-helix domain-containing protein [Natronorubrum texcoconense]|uniref:helix-hairpin-helix domain-containing protein n=1 Tax=Natronorubrum texcoconense TaxID=1095776 RepID=UPI000B7EDF57|nr:helix-hairpin-helix domain-containing protein [Natronorubrum texcoconense]